MSVSQWGTVEESGRKAVRVNKDSCVFTHVLESRGKKWKLMAWWVFSDTIPTCLFVFLPEKVRALAFIGGNGSFFSSWHDFIQFRFQVYSTPAKRLSYVKSYKTKQIIFNCLCVLLVHACVSSPVYALFRYLNQLSCATTSRSKHSQSKHSHSLVIEHW